MSTECVNCNLQNSTSQYAVNGGTNDTTIAAPRRRYNPIATFNSGVSSGTSNVVNKIVNVGTQSASSDASTKLFSQSSRSNVSTLQNIQKVLDVVSDVIVVVDTAKRSNVKLATDYQQQQLQNKQIASLNSLKKTSRAVDSSSTQSSQNTGTEKKKNKSYRNRNKSLGTSLSSSPLFKAQLAMLSPIKIKPLEMDKGIKLPSSFDGRIVWKDYIEPIRSQGLCGSCYAFAAVFVMSSRLAIYSKGKYQYQLSPSKLIFCSNPIESVGNDDERTEEQLIKDSMTQRLPFDYTTPQSIIRKNVMSCSGETLISAWQFLYRFGVPEDSCIGYGDNDNESIVNLTLTDVVDKTCVDALGKNYDVCINSKKMISHRAGGYYTVPKNEYEIRKDIYHWGPCSSGFVIYDDFLDWDGIGVYEWDRKSAEVGGHAIVLMGWGEEKDGKKYWIVRNSWGLSWGDRGYFKILRGENHCEIEENVFTGIPNIPAVRLYLEYPLYFQSEDYIYRFLWGLHDNGYKETTLEKVSSGKNDAPVNFNKVLYDISSLPNFATYVAGEKIEEFYSESVSCINSNWKLVLIIILLFIFFLCC